jgi:hypothetical protein
MSIKSRGPFGEVTLTGADAKRLLRHMAEETPSQAAKASLQRGRALLTDMEKNGQLLSHPSGRNDPN